MQYLRIKPRRIRLAVFEFTGCEGCELQLANREETLPAFLAAVEVVQFREISTASSDDYEVALIDGAITTDAEVARLKDIRRRAKVLVALGSCACFGGVNRLKNAYNLADANREVYGDQPKTTGPTRSVKEVVPVDLEIPGCPVSKEEVERIVQHVSFGLPFQFPAYPVCLECKQRFTSCMVEKGQLCLGTITRAGCNAPCPAGGLGCWGCRGPVDEPNLAEFRRFSEERGFTKAEVDERLAFFGGFEGVAR
jgi:coenzyme F420-reducing hydrogenase gamma subunit